MADGNPRLLEWLDKVLRNPGELGQGSVGAVLDRLEAGPAALRERVLADVLVAQMDGPMREMLGRARVYELPVPRGAVVEICEVGVAGLIERAVALGLLEESPGGEFRVPRVLPLEVVVNEELAARAARVLYRLWWEEAESSSEVQKLEIHRLAVEGKEEEIVSNVAYQTINNWRGKSRFREAVELGNTATTVTKNTNLLEEIAYSEQQLGNIERASQLYEEALEICPDIPEEKASLLHFVGMLKNQQGEILEAISLFERSLAITEQIGDVQGKAATLHELGKLKANQGDVEEAVALFQQSLAITEQIGEIQGKSATLHQLAILKVNQGDVEMAMAFYQQSLAIKEQVGDVQGKAATLHELAILKVSQGDVEGAIALFQQSLAITEQIGDVKGKAATLHELGKLKANQGDVEGAIALFQQSLAITEQIGNVKGKAATLAMMGQLLADKKGDSETATSYLQESLAILQRIGSPDARTVQNILNRISP